MDAPPRLFDRALLIERRRRADKAGAETFLLERVAADLAERLDAVQRRFELAIDLGTPGAALTNALMKNDQIGRLVVCEPLAELRAARCASPATRRRCPSRRARSISSCRRSHFSG